MSEKIFWWAFVVLPDRDWLQSSQVIVWWEIKDDITIHWSPQRIPFKNIGELRSQIWRFVQELVALQPKGMKVPISCWVWNTINAQSIVSQFWHRSLRKVIWWGTKAALMELKGEWKTQLIWPTSYVNRLKDWFSREAFFHGLWDLFWNVPMNKRVIRDKRLYNTADEMDKLWLWRDLRLLLWNYQIGIELINSIFSSIFDNPGLIPWEVQASEDLKDDVKKLAVEFARYAKDILVMGQSDKWYANRFISIDNKEDIRNLIFAVVELREIFCKTYLGELWFTHNVCMKPTWATPTPPFWDVAATFIADMIDERDGTLPSTASVNYWEEYT